MITTSPAELIALHAPRKEDGYYVVWLPGVASLSESSIAGAAAVLRLKSPEVTRIVESGQPLPLIRLSTSEEAVQLSDQLRASGIESATIPQAELHLDSTAKRVRALEISDEGLIASLEVSPERPAAPWKNVSLLVVGRLMVNRVEVENRRKRGRNQPVDTRQLSSDETVLDIYIESESDNWRISAGNFDFSCLGVAKSATSFENFTLLANLLRERAFTALFDDSYARVRSALTIVWPVESQERKGEWRRRGAGKYDMATVSTTDNETQFTRYSRLRHWLKLRELESER